MFKRIASLSVAAFLGVGSVNASEQMDDGAKRSEGFAVLPEANLSFQAGWASNAVLDDGSGTDVVEYQGEGSLDLRLLQGFLKRGTRLSEEELTSSDANRETSTRYLEIDLGYSAWKLGQNDGTDLDPVSRVLRVSADYDLFKGSALKGLTFGVLFEDASLDFGTLDFGDTKRLSTAFMFTERMKGQCELSTTTVFYGHEDFDDEQNAGDPDLDRTDDGNYQTYGLEQTLVFGAINEGEHCYRGGIWRRSIFYRNGYFRAGLRYRDEPTKGTLFDAERTTFYVEGQTPLWRQGFLTLEGRLDRTNVDYTQSRDDDITRGEVALRWLATTHRKQPWIQMLDFRVGVSGTRQDSNMGEFDYTRYAVFAGLQLRLGPARPGGPGTEGSSRVDRRDGAGGSEPVVQSDVDP